MPEATESSSNVPQIDYWNSVAGQTWVQFQEQLDRLIAPLGLEAIRALAPESGEHIIDIGCGCGDTTLDLAHRVGPGGRIVGVDISVPMLEVARRRPVPAGSARPQFRRLDAQTDDLGREVFDAAFSRFGVMFFSDPVAAFANIGAALKPQGRFVFVCWRSLRENPWMNGPLEAALQLMPPMPPSDPTAPGPYAFADRGRLRSILVEAGFSAVSIEPFDARIGGADIEATVQLTCRLGPVAAALREYPELHEKVADALRGVISTYSTPKGVLMPAAVWIVSARHEKRA